MDIMGLLVKKLRSQSLGDNDNYDYDYDDDDYDDDDDDDGLQLTTTSSLPEANSMQQSVECDSGTASDATEETNHECISNQTSTSANDVTRSMTPSPNPLFRSERPIDDDGVPLSASSARGTEAAGDTSSDGGRLSDSDVERCGLYLDFRLFSSPSSDMALDGDEKAKEEEEEEGEEEEEELAAIYRRDKRKRHLSTSCSSAESFSDDDDDDERHFQLYDHRRRCLSSRRRRRHHRSRRPSSSDGLRSDRHGNGAPVVVSGARCEGGQKVTSPSSRKRSRQTSVDSVQRPSLNLYKMQKMNIFQKYNCNNYRPRLVKIRTIGDPAKRTTKQSLATHSPSIFCFRSISWTSTRLQADQILNA